jgi:hypothetical protein
MTTKLSLLFKRRSEQFNKTTKVIEGALEPTLRAIRTHLANQQGQDFADVVEWIGFGTGERTDSADDTDYLVIVAKANYTIDQPFQDADGNYIASMSPTDVAHLSQPFQVIMPMALAEEGDEAKVLKFFEDLQQERKEMSEAWMGAFDDEAFDDDDDEGINVDDELEMLDHLRGPTEKIIH